MPSIEIDTARIPRHTAYTIAQSAFGAITAFFRDSGNEAMFQAWLRDNYGQDKADERRQQLEAREREKREEAAAIHTAKRQHLLDELAKLG